MTDPGKNRELVKAFWAEIFKRHDLTGPGRFMRDDYIRHHPGCPLGKSGIRYLPGFLQSRIYSQDFLR